MDEYYIYFYRAGRACYSKLLLPYYSALHQIDYYEMPPGVTDMPIFAGAIVTSSSPRVFLCLLWLRKSGKYFRGDQKCEQSDTKGFDNLDRSYDCSLYSCCLVCHYSCRVGRVVIIGSTTCNCSRKSFWQDGYHRYFRQ